MKHLKFTGMMLVLSLSLILSACSDDGDTSENNTGGNTGNNTENPTNTTNMTGKINGTSFSWTGTAKIIEDAIELKASGSSFAPRITLSMPKAVVVGETYQFALEGAYKVYYLNNEGANILAEEGTVTITEYDKTKKTIKGTFNFNISGTVYYPAYSITEGSFNYVYEIQ